MVNNRRRVLAAKYSAFALWFILLQVLQETPHFLVIGEAKPYFLIPAAVALAMYEGEFVGGLFGALAGMLLDMGSFALYGLSSVWMLCCWTAVGLLVIYLLQRTLRVAFLLTLGVSMLCLLLRFYFDSGLWGYEGSMRLLLHQTLPAILYTTLLTPLFFWGWGRMERYFNSKINV